MSHGATEDERGTESDDHTERYGELTVEGDHVIYDRENPQAWIQSAETIEVVSNC